MTVTEFSNKFDILYNNIASNQAPGLDEYEKSVFLTKAQDDIVLQWYRGAGQFNDNFEGSEEARRNLSNLIKTDEIEPLAASNTTTYVPSAGEDSYFFELPEGLWVITYETVKVNEPTNSCLNNQLLSVVPITQDDFYKINNNPFKQSNSRRALRLDYNEDIVEIVSKYNLSKYVLKYLKQLDPIILEDLTDGLKINDETASQTCSLHPNLHQDVLDRAVQLAIASYLPHTVNKQ